MKKKQIVTLAVVLITLSAFGQNKTMKLELAPQFKTYFNQELLNQSGTKDEGEIPGFSVIITRKDSILYIGNYGSSNLEKASLISENTVFDIASVAKQITGMAIALLEQQGKVDPDDKIIEYLPDLPDIMDDITVYQLIHHTSGIRDWPTLFALKGWQPEEPLSLNNIYEILKRQEDLNFTPGTEFLYSNSNYNLLAKIVEAATDTSFSSWSNDNIFVPLGMVNTYYCENENSEEMASTHSYFYSGDAYHPFRNTLNAPGSSSLRSSSSDMSKWITNFYSKTLGGSSVYNSITHKGNLNDTKTINYGYGLNITEVNNKTAYIHDGAWGGFRSGTAYFPDEGIGVVILSNNGTLQPGKMINDVAAILFSTKEDNNDNGGEVKEKVINDAFFSLCAGKYEQVDDKGFYLTFLKKGEEYFVNLYDKDFKLYAKSDSVFFVKEAPVELVFHLENGKVNSHTLKQNGKNYLAFKVDEAKNEIDLNYNKFIGEYYSSELDIIYEVKFENNELRIVSPVFPEDIILEHSENLTFISNSGLMQSISFLKNRRSISALVISNQRARNILFERR